MTWSSQSLGDEAPRLTEDGQVRITENGITRLCLPESVLQWEGAGQDISAWSTKAPRTNPWLVAGEIDFLPESESLFTAFTVEPTVEQKQLYDGVIRSLIDDDVWDLLDILHLPVHYGDGWLINWKTPGTFDATVVGAPTFTAFSGVATDGTTNLVELYNPATAGGTYTQDSAHFGLWINDDKGGGYGPAGGRFNGVDGVRLNPRSSNDRIEARINQQAVSTTDVGSITTAVGHTLLSRLTIPAVFRNGVIAPLVIQPDAPSTPIVDGTLVIGGDTGAPDNAVNVFAAHAGGALLASNAAPLYEILSSYRDSVL